MSELQIVADEANVEKAHGQLDGAIASLKNAKLNLSYTRVEAQISGQISRYYLTPGNLITQDQTLLTTIVSTDYMYAYFDVEERISQRINVELSKSPSFGMPYVEPQAIRAVAGGLSGLSPLQKSNFPVLMATEGQTGFPYRGKLDFLNNQVNPSTGTIAMRGYFKNARLGEGLFSLIPGKFVRIRLPIGAPHKAQLVIDRAIGSDQGLKFVYVLDAENKVQYRRVITGALQEDGLRVIEDYHASKGKDDLETGIKPDEWVVVGGLQQLKPRLKIQPDQVAMPTLTNDTTDRRKPQGKDSGDKNSKNAKKQ